MDETEENNIAICTITEMSLICPLECQDGVLCVSRRRNKKPSCTSTNPG
jgi:hypothetical protein